MSPHEVGINGAYLVALRSTMNSVSRLSLEDWFSQFLTYCNTSSKSTKHNAYEQIINIKTSKNFGKGVKVFQQGFSSKLFQSFPRIFPTLSETNFSYWIEEATFHFSPAVYSFSHWKYMFAPSHMREVLHMLGRGQRCLGSVFQITVGRNKTS